MRIALAQMLSGSDPAANLYAYVAGDPVNATDELGLIASPIIEQPKRPSQNTSCGSGNSEGGQNTRLAQADRPISRCPGLGGLRCGAPVSPGGVNPDYPKVCPECLIRNGLYPKPGAPIPEGLK